MKTGSAALICLSVIITDKQIKAADSVLIQLTGGSGKMVQSIWQHRDALQQICKQVMKLPALPGQLKLVKMKGCAANGLSICSACAVKQRLVGSYQMLCDAHCCCPLFQVDQSVIIRTKGS
jgi:hypothetical protein